MGGETGFPTAASLGASRRPGLSSAVTGFFSGIARAFGGVAGFAGGAGAGDSTFCSRSGPRITTSSEPHIARPSRLPPLGAPNSMIAMACSSIDRTTNCASGERVIASSWSAQRGGSGRSERCGGGR